MKKILVPCDFSNPSLEALRFAMDIAAKGRGNITLLHVIELPSLYPSAAARGFEADYKREAAKIVQGKLQKLAAKWPRVGVRVSTEVQFGRAVTRIREFIARKKPDVVLMGTHGASGIKDLTIGSNAEKIVRSSSVPVIAVKKAPFAVKEIVFPVRPDLKQEELTMKVKALQDFFGAHLHMVYVNTPNFFTMDTESRAYLQAMAKRFMFKDYTLTVYNDRTEEEGIVHFAHELKADMIAMRTHGRRGIARLATGSIAEDVVNHIDCAVWTYKIK